MSQDETIRALERELLRSGRSLYEWAKEICTKQERTAFEVVAEAGAHYDMADGAFGGLRFLIFNAGPRARVVRVILDPPPHVVDDLGPSVLLENGSDEDDAPEYDDAPDEDIP